MQHEINPAYKILKVVLSVLVSLNEVLIPIIPEDPQRPDERHHLQISFPYQNFWRTLHTVCGLANIIIISCVHHQECIVPVVASSVNGKSGWFSATLTASGQYNVYINSFDATVPQFEFKTIIYVKPNDKHILCCSASSYYYFHAMPYIVRTMLWQVWQDAYKLR